jgi:hypothetical protein
VLELVSGDPPIRIGVAPDDDHYSDGWSLVMPRELVEGDHPPRKMNSPIAVRDWLVARGAFDGDASYLEINLEGQSESAVTIVGIEAEVTQRDAPLAGASVTSPSAGARDVIAVEFDLDKPRDVAMAEDGSPFFEDQAISLSHGEVEVVKVVAHARRSAVHWQLVVTYFHRGEHKRRILKNGGEPFRTAPTAAAKAHYEWAWYERTPSLKPAE